MSRVGEGLGGGYRRASIGGGEVLDPGASGASWSVKGFVFCVEIHGDEMPHGDKITTQAKRGLRANLRWFTHSGILEPRDGSWGVAEHIVMKDNQSLTGQTAYRCPGRALGQSAHIEGRSNGLRFSFEPSLKTR